jgi:hypothetical protein
MIDNKSLFGNFMHPSVLTICTLGMFEEGQTIILWHDQRGIGRAVAALDEPLAHSGASTVLDSSDLRSL